MAMIEVGFERQNFHPLKRKSALLLKLIAVVFAVLLFCEFLIYYLVIFQCNWPEVKTTAYDGEQASREPVLKAMFLADTHLLGEFLGHWLDKLRREWQMERAFQTALWLLQPEVVFILGDVFDEGKWSTPEAWADDVERFQKMFRHPSHVQLKVVAGNHDIGFHYEMNTYKVERFEKVFSSERLFSWKGINFVMVNSVALNGDGCGICSEAEAELIEVSHRLNCSRELLWWLQPRLVLSGHTHSACEVHHGGRVPELSVPSFSWRNRNNPSFIMGSITPTDYALSKCYLPREDVVLVIYCGAVGFLVVLTLSHLGLLASPFLSGLNLLRKRKTR
ncbi:PREDICTED: metallophosphoesterase 1 isoform X2 [Mandrillus leucophaeus]|uniref:Metallophosphoesterase 1 n=2 Tax=Cercopithecinae TaxID=9528 RepID=A0A2K6A590_MANLE|nr:PREDICTED: metallophosphoesterase 1 isoform X2 [Mandrillus leucophaeus]XP_025220756.1 metallophosphoesterase 1 isoform X4 [Theropithecus gelada]XP_025220757.1 metallophosphoesterase 1 isoform X4 [Theropithecus gelada]